MNPSHIAVTRRSATEWDAVHDGRLVGSGATSQRPDDRVFLSIDTWDDEAFVALADTLLADLSGTLHTVVDEADLDLRTRWERAGFRVGAREWEYVVPTDPATTGLAAVRPPGGVSVVPVGEADPALLRAVDRIVRDEIGAGIGWQQMPAEVIALPPGVTVVDPSRYAAAARDGEYVGLLRLAALTRQPRIGLVAVRTDERRRGLARAMLAVVLGTLHRQGKTAVTAEVKESHAAAVALFEGVGARRSGSNLELVVR